MRVDLFKQTREEANSLITQGETSGDAASLNSLFPYIGGMTAHS